MDRCTEVERKKIGTTSNIGIWYQKKVPLLQSLGLDGKNQCCVPGVTGAI